MTLVIRNGRPYQYTCHRKNGRAKCLYRGSGEFAVWAQAMDDWERRELEDDRRQQAEIDEEHRQALLVEQARGRNVSNLVRIGLEANGFVRYSRNPWKNRVMRSLLGPASLARASKIQVSIEIRQLIAALVRGDQTVVSRLQTNARERPAMFADEVELDLVQLARRTLADREFTDSKLRDDLITRMALVTGELAGDNPSVARRLCAEAAGFAWAETWVLNMTLGANGVQQQSPMASRRLSAAQSRLLKALKTHAQVEAALNRRLRRTQQTIDVEFRER
jgi:hypothetical protein